MAFGLFGKLPQKRDFIAVNMPPPLLNPLETWLQQAVAASRAELGRGWEELYLVAPIWRFWIGPGVFGTGCAGAVMPSVDGVGRYFPLLAVYACDNGAAMPPPPFAPQGEWFAAVETRLLSTLDAEAEVNVETLLVGLAEPSLQPAMADVSEFKGGTLWHGAPKTGAAALLTGVVEADYRRAARRRSFWWTAGSETNGPALYIREGMPDPYFYTLMLKPMAD